MASGRIPSGPWGPSQFRDPVQPDRDPQRSFNWGSPAARQHIQRPAPATDFTSIWQIVRADSWEALKPLALTVLGPESHMLGFCFGVAEGGWGVIEGLLGFLQMIVLNGIYQKIHGPWGMSSWDPISRWESQAWDYLLHSRLEEAHRQFRQLMDELHLVVSNPREFFGNVWNSEVNEYSQKWKRYTWLLKHPSIANEFQRGRLEGQTALEVVLLLATVIDGVGLAVKGVKAIGDLPALARLARGVTKEEAEALLKARRFEDLRTGGGGTVEEPPVAAARSKPASSSWKFLPKQTGRIEPGAVPGTPELKQAMVEAEARTAPTAPDGSPVLPARDATTFGATPKLTDIGGKKLYRVIGRAEEPTNTGSYWSLDPPPTIEDEWRGSAAVKDAWNGDGGYITATAPDGLKAWTGPAAPQPAAVEGYVLPGGGNQVYVPRGTLIADGPPQPTPWNTGAK